MTAWQTIVKYESKLVTRNWIFRLFIIGILWYTLGYLMPWDIHREIWWKIAFTSSIPARGTYFLNLLQSLIVIFLVCDIQRKRNQTESREVLHVKPIGNIKLFTAEFIGIALPFFIVNTVFIILCLFINSLIPDAQTIPWVYLSFLVRDILPTFIFVAGISLLTNKILRHPFLSWLLLTIFLYTSYTYLTEPLHGIVDFRGSMLPESFSALTGFMHSGICSLQRIVFLLLGLGLLSIAAPLSQRLPNTPKRDALYLFIGCLFLLSALGGGYIYIHKFQKRQQNRETYREFFSRYEAYPKVRIKTHHITYQPEGKSFSATSRMKVINPKTEKVNHIILFLNPGLKISSLTSEKEKVSFHRNQQVIIIEKTLAPKDSIILELQYNGYIDEDIYNINIDDKKYFAPVQQTRQVERYGKRSAFLSNEYTLLIPEILWYPTAVTPTASQPSKETDFTSYTLHVNNQNKQTVISQGIPDTTQNRVTFHNLQALTGLSLCIGNYIKRSITVDSITLEYYTYPGNDFYLKPLDNWWGKNKEDSTAKRYKKELIAKCRNRLETNMPNRYPFKLLKIVETPSAFLNSYPCHNNIQPELVFFKERILTSYNKPGKFSPDKLEEENIQEEILLREFPRFLSVNGIERLFSDFHWSTVSDQYVGIAMLFGKMANPSLDKLNLFPSMLDSIATIGFEKLIRRGNTPGYNKLINMKISQFLAYLTTITSWDSVRTYIQEFYTNTPFQEVDFSMFMTKFQNRFKQNIKPFVNEWYSTKEIPRLVVKDLEFHQTKDIQSINFKIGNIGKVDGIVSIIRSYEDDNGKWVIGNWRSYLIKPGEYKQIIANEIGTQDDLFLSTNFSRNIPERLQFGGSNTPLWEGEILTECCVPLTKEEFYPRGEIIIDNENEGFHLIDSAGNKLVNRLADHFTKDDEEEYRIGVDFKKESWGKPFIERNDVYGEDILSAFIKVAGNGNCKAVWSANLPEAGEYEILVYQTNINRGGTGEYSYKSNHPGMKNYFTIYTPKGSEEIVLEHMENETESWISLGTFTLPAGESRVILDDRGVPPIQVTEHRKYAQLIVADAVKWVKISK